MSVLGTEFPVTSSNKLLMPVLGTEFCEKFKLLMSVLGTEFPVTSSNKVQTVNVCVRYRVFCEKFKLLMSVLGTEFPVTSSNC